MLRAYWRQGASVLTAVIVGKAISLLWKIYVARLGPTNFGVVEIALTTFFTLSSFSLLGFHTALMRFVAIAAAQNNRTVAIKLLRLSIELTLGLSLLVIAFFWLFPTVLPAIIPASSRSLQDIERYLWIVPVLTASEILWSYFAATNHIRLYAITKYVLSPIFRLIGLFMLMTFGLLSQSTLILHLCIASSLSLGIAALFIKWDRLRKQSDPELKQQFLTFSFTMSGSFIAFVLYGALDVFFVARFLGPASVGLLAGLSVLTHDSLDAILGPVLNIFQSNLGSAYKNISKGFLFTLANIGVFLAVGGVMGMGIFAIRHLLIHFLLGDAYQGITPFIAVFLGVHLIDTAITLPLRHFLDFYGHVNTTLTLMIIALIAKGTVGFLTIPHYGLYGVFIAQLVSVVIHLTSAGIMSVVLARQRSVK